MEVGNGNLREAIPLTTASKANYAVPVVTAITWTAALVTTIIYVNQDGQDYENSDNMGSKSEDHLKLGLKALAGIGASTIPASILATILRASYHAYKINHQGVPSPRDRFSQIVNESVSLERIGKPEAIIVNTVAAALIGPLLGILSYIYARRRMA